MNLYVGNLSSETSERQLRREFERFGKVGRISMAEKPRPVDDYGFCFVEMPFDYQASIAIRELSGKTMDGKPITVTESGIGA